MRRVISTFVVFLIICTSAFAAQAYLNIGVGYQYKYGQYYLSDSYKERHGHQDKYREAYRWLGMGDIHADLEVQTNGGFLVYTDIGVSKLKELEKDTNIVGVDWTKYDVDNGWALSYDCGIGYAVGFGRRNRFAIGIGPHTDFTFYNAVDENNELRYINNFGVGFLVELNLLFTNELGLTLAAKPSVNIYNVWNNRASGEKGNGFTIGSNANNWGFFGTALVGLAYRFN